MAVSVSVALNVEDRGRALFDNKGRTVLVKEDIHNTGFLCMWWVKPEYKCETAKHRMLYKQNQTVTSVDSQWQKKNSVKRSVRWAKSHKNFSIKSCRAESSSSNRGKNWWKDTYSDQLRVFLEKKERKKRKKRRRGKEDGNLKTWAGKCFGWAKRNSWEYITQKQMTEQKGLEYGVAL